MITFTTPSLRSNDTTCKYWVEWENVLAATRLFRSLFILITVSIKVLSIVLRLEIVHQLPFVGITLLCLSPFQEAVRHVCHLNTGGALQQLQLPSHCLHNAG